MSSESRLKFNNASQRLFGNLVHPTILVWKTNDAAKPRYAAEARLVGTADDVNLTLVVGRAFSMIKEDAKDMAAQFAFEFLIAEYGSE